MVWKPKSFQGGAPTFRLPDTKLLRGPLCIACTVDPKAAESAPLISAGKYVWGFEGSGEPGDLISRNLVRRRQALQLQQEEEGPPPGEGWLSGLQQKTFPLGPNPNAPSVQVRGPVQ